MTTFAPVKESKITHNKMRSFLLLMLGLWLSLGMSAQRTIVVEKGNVKSLLSAIKQANELNKEKDAEQLFILIPDGYYDLGETVLTRISGHNVALVGQSTQGTIIRNAPDKSTESISKTSVFQNRGTGNYFQDLTLRNDLDYYGCEPDGRAVCLQDKGHRTICNRVRMLSYQDTYYSDNDHCQHYMQDTEIHGTLDFICGAGDVWFERCRIVTEKRSADGSGINIIAAPRTSKTPWGYVFNRCTIESHVSQFNYGRSWHTNPRCVWMHTTLLQPELLVPTRFDAKGMKISSNYFKEYHTMDASGRDITPSSNVVTFTLRDDSQPYVAETIMTREEYRQHTLKKIFTDWQPRKELRKWEKRSKKLKKLHQMD